MYVQFTSCVQGVLTASVVQQNLKTFTGNTCNGVLFVAKLKVWIYNVTKNRTKLKNAIPQQFLRSFLKHLSYRIHIDNFFCFQCKVDCPGDRYFAILPNSQIFGTNETALSIQSRRVLTCPFEKTYTVAIYGYIFRT